MKRVLTALAATLPFAANAADAISGAVERQPTNWQAIIMFLIFVVFTLGITSVSYTHLVHAACCNRARRDTLPTGSPAVDLPPGRQHALTVPR